MKRRRLQRGVGGSVSDLRRQDQTKWGALRCLGRRERNGLMMMIVVEMGQERTGWSHERNDLSHWDLLGGGGGGPYLFGPCLIGHAMSFVDGADDDTSSNRHDRLRTQP